MWVNLRSKNLLKSVSSKSWQPPTGRPMALSKRIHFKKTREPPISHIQSNTNQLWSFCLGFVLCFKDTFTALQAHHCSHHSWQESSFLCFPDLYLPHAVVAHINKLIWLVVESWRWRIFLDSHWSEKLHFTCQAYITWVQLKSHLNHFGTWRYSHDFIPNSKCIQVGIQVTQVSKSQVLSESVLIAQASSKLGG